MNLNIKFTKDTIEKEFNIPRFFSEESKDKDYYKYQLQKDGNTPYLHFSSCHPHNTKTSIPYNLARGICTIVSLKDTRNLRLTF